MNEDNNLDLLDLDDGASMDALPDATPFAAPRPKKPWLLLGIGLVVIILSTYVIIRMIGGDSSSSIDVDLDAPAVIVDGVDVPAVNVAPAAPQPVQVAPQPAQPVAVAQQPTAPAASVAQPKPVAQPDTVQATAGVPVRVVEDRREVTFNPDKPAAQKKVTAQPKKAPAKTTTKKSASKAQVAPKGSWYVQFGSYSTRALAENAERQIRAGHSGLFAGRQFVILAAQLPNGTTTYRLRIAFATSADANGFCQNAKSDGLDCYVAK